MQMTKEEIIKNYKEAKAPSKQISILAQLNCCDAAEIREILKEAGVLRKYERKRNAEPVKSKAAKKPVTSKNLRTVPVDQLDFTVEADPEPESEAKVPVSSCNLINLIKSRLEEIKKEISYHQEKIDNLKAEAEDLKGYLKK